MKRYFVVKKWESVSVFRYAEFHWGSDFEGAELQNVMHVTKRTVEDFVTWHSRQRGATIFRYRKYAREAAVKVKGYVARVKVKP